MFLYNFIIHPIESFYRAIYLLLADWLGNYGIAIVALSLFSFVILYPFTKRAHQIQQEELHLQKILQEQLKTIKVSYSGAEQFEKIQRLYDRYSYHPIMAVRSILGLLIQLPFLLAVFYMIASCTEIQGVPWGIIHNLGKPDSLVHGINLLPFVMTFVSVTYAFVVPGFDRKHKIQTIVVSFLFLLLLYSAPSAMLIYWTCNIVWSLLGSILSKKLQRLGEYIAENKLAFHIIFALALTAGLFVPTEIYIKNASQLWFDYQDLLKFLLLNLIEYVAILSFVYVICRYNKLHDICQFVLAGLLLGVFLQSYIIGLNYGAFDGHTIEWELFTVDGLVNLLVWFACFGVSYAVFVKQKLKFRNIIKSFSFLLIIIQCLVLVLTAVRNPIQKDVWLLNGKTGVLTTQDIYTVSGNDNIIVFLLDSFDASLFEEILEKKPEVRDSLNGFTYYPDTVSSYGFTHFSLPEILTGKYYDSRYHFIDYLTKAWESNSYYKLLKDHKFSIDLYTNGAYVAVNSPVDNLVSTKVFFDENTAVQFGQLVKFRISPHFLKHIYYQHQTEIQNPTITNKNIKRYQENDREFYISLKNGLKLKEEGNSLKFYHLNGLHRPFKLDEDVNYLEDETKGSAYVQALASLKIVTEYISQMKKLGIYDNAVFVILADHGLHNTIGSRPIFLLKEKSNRGFSVNYRPTEVSELMSFITQKYRNTDLQSEKVAFEKQRFYYYEDEKRHFNKFLVKSPAKDTNKWVPLGRVEKIVDRKYNLGEVIDFSYLGNSFNYKESGWYTREFYTGSAIAQREAELILQIEKIAEVKKDLKLNCTFAGELRGVPFQIVRLFVNGCFIGDLKFDNGSSNVTYMIPRHIVNQKEVKIKFLVDRSEKEPVFDAGNTIWLQLVKMRLSEGD